MEKVDEVIVYADQLSQPCRAVLIFLKVNNISHTLLQPGVDKKHSTTILEDQTKINLIRLVPEINDNGFLLSEGDAILKYLSSRYAVPAHWYPTDVHQRARIDEFCSWCSANIHTAASNIYIYQVLDPKIKNIPVDRDRLRRHQVELNRGLDVIENRFLGGGRGEGMVGERGKEVDSGMDSPRDWKQFLGGGEDPSIADLIGLCEIMHAVTAGANAVTDGRPKVAAWLERVKARLQPHFDDVHEALRRAKDLHHRPAMGRLIYQCSSFDVDY